MPDSAVIRAEWGEPIDPDAPLPDGRTPVNVWVEDWSYSEGDEPMESRKPTGKGLIGQAGNRPGSSVRGAAAPTIRPVIEPIGPPWWERIDPYHPIVPVLIVTGLLLLRWLLG